MFIRGDLFFVDLENIKSISANESLIKWNQFTALPDPQCHKKIIFDIIHCNNKIITLSLDRLVSNVFIKLILSYFILNNLRIKIKLLAK